MALQRDFTMGLDEATGKFVINGKPFDPNRVDVRTRLGTTEVWKITNTDTRLGIPHSLHCHLVQFRVLDRDGKPPAPHESGLMDVVPIHPGESVRVAATLTDYPGRYVYHCHMLDHAQRGMMAVLEIRP